jgi:hypothetical protein
VVFWIFHVYHSFPHSNFFPFLFQLFLHFFYLAYLIISSIFWPFSHSPFTPFSHFFKNSFLIIVFPYILLEWCFPVPHFLILIPSSFRFSCFLFSHPLNFLPSFSFLALTFYSIESFLQQLISLFSSFSSTTVTLFFLTFSRGGLLDIPHLSLIINSFFFSSGLLIVFSFPPFFHAPSISSTLSFTHPHFFNFSFFSYLTTTLILFIHSYISSSFFFPLSFHVPTLSFSLPFFLISSFTHSLLCSKPLISLSSSTTTLTLSSLHSLRWSPRRSTSFTPTFPLSNSSFSSFSSSLIPSFFSYTLHSFSKLVSDYFLHVRCCWWSINSRIVLTVLTEKLLLINLQSKQELRCDRIRVGSKLSR